MCLSDFVPTEEPYTGGGRGESVWIRAVGNGDVQYSLPTRGVMSLDLACACVYPILFLQKSLTPDEKKRKISEGEDEEQLDYSLSPS